MAYGGVSTATSSEDGYSHSFHDTCTHVSTRGHQSLRDIKRKGCGPGPVGCECGRGQALGMGRFPLVEQGSWLCPLPILRK